MYQITKHINRLEFLDHIFNYVIYDLFVDILGCASEAYRYQLNVFNVAIFSTDSRRNNNVMSTSKLCRNGVLRKNGVIKAKTVIFKKAHGGHLGKRRPHWNDQSYFPHTETYHTSIPNRLLKRLLPLQGDIEWKDFAWPAIICSTVPNTIRTTISDHKKCIPFYFTLPYRYIFCYTSPGRIIIYLCYG